MTDGGKLLVVTNAIGAVDGVNDKGFVKVFWKQYSRKEKLHGPLPSFPHTAGPPAADPIRPVKPVVEVHSLQVAPTTEMPLESVPVHTLEVPGTCAPNSVRSMGFSSARRVSKSSDKRSATGAPSVRTNPRALAPSRERTAELPELIHATNWLLPGLLRPAAFARVLHCRSAPAM